MKPQITASYEATAPYQGELVKIVGESFDLPVHETVTKSIQLHTQIKFYVKNIELKSKTRRIAEQISQTELAKIVNHYKENLNEIF